MNVLDDYYENDSQVDFLPVLRRFSMDTIAGNLILKPSQQVKVMDKSGTKLKVPQALAQKITFNFFDINM